MCCFLSRLQLCLQSCFIKAQGTFTRRGNGCYCQKSPSTNVLREHLQLWYGVALIVKCLLIVCSLGIAGVQCSVYRGPVCVLVKTVGLDFFKILKFFQFWDVRWWLSGFKAECFFVCLGHFGVKVKAALHLIALINFSALPIRCSLKTLIERDFWQ